MRPQDFVLSLIQLEHEIFRKTLSVALHLLIQALDIHPVELRKIAIEDDFLMSEDDDFRFDRSKNGRLSLRHKNAILNAGTRLKVTICNLRRASKT